jgi:hypothetical protein
VAECATQCTNSTLRRFANNILGINDLCDTFLILFVIRLCSQASRANETNTLIAQLTPVLYCDFYIERINAVRKDSCKNILYVVFVNFFLLSASLFLFLFFALFLVPYLSSTQDWMHSYLNHVAHHCGVLHWTLRGRHHGRQAPQH